VAQRHVWTASDSGTAGIAAKGLVKVVCRGNTRFRPMRPRMRTTNPLAQTRSDGPVAVAMSAQAPLGADQHAKAPRIHEAYLAKVNHELPAAGVDRLVQAVAQRRRAGDIDLAANLHDGGASARQDREL
jgi:hypothetical protein